MTIKIEVGPAIASAPISDAGLITLSDLRDLLEVLDGEPENNYLMVLDGELRYEMPMDTFPAGWDKS